MGVSRRRDEQAKVLAQRVPLSVLIEAARLKIDAAEDEKGRDGCCAQVHLNTVRRGYTRGWTPEQFVARNAVKLLEEGGELLLELAEWMPPEFIAKVKEVVEAAKALFDSDYHRMTSPSRTAIRLAVAEAFDVQVVLCNIAEGSARAIGEEIDPCLGAKKKSEADIARGVRGEKKEE